MSEIKDNSKRICITEETFISGKRFRVNEYFDVPETDFVLSEANEVVSCRVKRDDQWYQLEADYFVIIPKSSIAPVCKDFNDWFQERMDITQNYQTAYKEWLGIEPPKVIGVAVERKKKKDETEEMG